MNVLNEINELNNLRYDAVITDMDGTLVDSERVMLDLWDRISRSKGCVFSRADMLRTVGTTYEETIRIMVDAYPEAPHEEIRAEMSERYREIRESGKLELRPGVAEFLTEVSSRGVRIGLCTSTKRAPARVLLEAVGILRYFNALVCVDDVTRGKPDPEPYLLASQRLGVRAGRCLVIEDTPSGARAALSAGMAVAVVPDLISMPAEVAAKVTVLDNILSALPLIIA